MSTYTEEIEFGADPQQIERELIGMIFDLTTAMQQQLNEIDQLKQRMRKLEKKMAEVPA